MKKTLRLTLFKAIQDWVEKECDHPERPSVGLIHDSLAEQMTRAAEAVYDATFAAQLYQKVEDGQ